MDIFRVARAVRAFGSSTDQEKVDDMLKRFKKLKEDFDRGMATQILQGLAALLDDCRCCEWLYAPIYSQTMLAADRQLLRTLVTPDASYDPSAGCLEGTRMGIRNDIEQWVKRADHSQSLYWLYGLAGCGKSTVARSICKQLDSAG